MSFPPKPGLKKEQKIGVVLLSIFAILLLSLGALQIRNTLYAPFALSSQVPPSVKDDINSVDALRFRDTDSDGLTDFDEVYVYGTSPYLYDTFSYGISDKEVVAKGLPLCPNGQDCQNPITTGETIAAPNNASSTAAALKDELLQNPPPSLNSILSSPTQLRLLLRQSGVEQKIIDSVTDAELMQMVNQLVNTSTLMQNINSLNSVAPANSAKP